MNTDAPGTSDSSVSDASVGAARRRRRRGLRGAPSSAAAFARRLGDRAWRGVGTGSFFLGTMRGGGRRWRAPPRPARGVRRGCRQACDAADTATHGRRSTATRMPLDSFARNAYTSGLTAADGTRLLPAGDHPCIVIVVLAAHSLSRGVALADPRIGATARARGVVPVARPESRRHLAGNRPAAGVAEVRTAAGRGASAASATAIHRSRHRAAASTRSARAAASNT